jgi:DNA primase
MAIPQTFLQELLARADVVEIVGRYVQLKKGGANFMGLCPFHGEKSPSFSVSPAKQFYHCFGCGKNGNAISFLMDHAGMTFIEAVKDLAQQYGLQVPEEEGSAQDRARALEQRQKQNTLTGVLEKAGEAYRRQLKDSPRAVAYFKGRGVSGEIAKQFGLGYAPEGWRSLASVFPHYDDPLLVESGLVISSMAASPNDEPGPHAPSLRASLPPEGAQSPLGRPGGETGAHAPSLRASLPPEGVQSALGRPGDETRPHAAPLRAAMAEGDKSEEKRYDRFRDRVMFPIRNIKGECIGFGGRVLGDDKPKYLNSPETPVFSKGRELYGLFEARHALREHGYVLVTEGYMDVVALAQLGFPNAVATLGTACTADHIHKLFRFTDSVVFSFDGDSAGRRAARKALDAALPYATDVRSIKFLFLPDEHDPDSFIRANGREAFAQFVSEATPLSRFLMEAARDGCDLDSAEGRAHMTANARPLWMALPEGALKMQLLTELAKHAQLESESLKALWAPAAVPARGENDTRRKARAPDREAPFPDGAAWEDSSRYRAPYRRAPLRAQPASRADHAARILLGHSDLWETLTAEDHGLLCELPTPHGPLMVWLEAQLHEHGPLAWGALRDELQGQAAQDLALRLMADPALPGGSTGEVSADAARELRDLLNRMLVERIKEQETLAIEAGAQDPGALVRYRELHARRLQLEQATRPAP